jgi:glucose-1-phosphate thymidylyltransferase
MKAVILAAGEGLRCRPLTLTRSKVMLPVANRPILEYIINALAKNGILDIILVVGYKKERIMDYFGDGINFGVRISYVEQNGQLGTAHAIKQTESLIDEKFLVLNGDNLIDPDTISDLLKSEEGDSTLLTVVRDQSIGYGVVTLDKGFIARIIEKPREKISHLINTGIYVFSPSIFSVIKSTPISEIGEYAITDTIQKMIDNGARIKNVTTESTWIDAVHSWDLLKANAALLAGFDDMPRKGEIEEGAVIIGNVGLGENTIIRAGSYIVGPVLIGKNCEIGPNSVILPSTAIGNNCSIGSFTELENSIILNDVRVGTGSFVSTSVIGAHTILGTHFASEVKKELMIEMKGILHHADQLGTIVGDGNTIGTRVLIQAGKMISTGCSVESGVTVSKDIPENSIVL